MRILVICPEQLPVPPIKGGSVESVTYNIFKRMAQSEKVVLLSRSHPRLPRVSRYVGGNLLVIRVPSRKPFAYLRSALGKVAGRSFHIIQIENRPRFVPYVRKVFPRTPIMLSLHSLTFMSRLSQPRANAILRQVNGVTSVSSFVTNTMRRRYPAHARKFRTAIPGVDAAKFRPWSAASKLRLRRRMGLAGSFNVLFVGRMVRGKGLHTLIRSVALLKRRIPNIRLVAVGASWPGVRRQTAYMRYVRSLSKRLRVPVRFTGYVPPSRVHQMFQLGDVFVCPTLFREGLATVNSEAMASGIPVVASNRGGIREVVVHGHSGLLVNQAGSPAAFARAIARIRSNPALRRRLVANGRARVRSAFNWHGTVRRLKTHYRAVRS
ncbi:glycosyltransferase family 4 protein [Brevibacillus thermoruber]|uniref:Glycosyltransferase family 4 protein n=1 Tax=Brevibacillus thermoruber TaxID=33942 RepID=A0A9X3Z1W2_9BACL|nr:MULTISPECIES: glycosyltransferase family 4 protein [Brevibacillus]MDA5107131.1 glycosyltransferase family 4 protein [Brevibacillus thermoruber]UYZ11601.1 glycosyltransferase family 4 protein [Brevibacillus sp. WF146]